MRLSIKIMVSVAATAVIGGAAAFWMFRPASGTEARFQTSSVRRSDLVAVIAATGTVEPEEVVDVGAQVAGQINSFGKDANGKQVDYGSPVEEGTVLAVIDDSLYAAAAEQAKANVAAAEANVLQAQAKLVEAKQDWERAQKLGPSEALSAILYDQYRAAFDTASANVAAAQAMVAQANASLTSAQRNLQYCTIKSPVKGVIVDRRVNIGQTVVSSLSAPSLFLLAKDLNRIQVWVSVNEADIGQIHPGEPATFTVDAFAGKVFRGSVGKVRLNATMTQNVVTYTVEVNTDNSDGKLLPYLTASAQFETARRENVLVVPSVALRWWPSPGDIAPDFRGKSGATLRTPGQAGAASRPEKEDAASPTGVVWVPEGKFVRPVSVVVELSDGAMTQVSGSDVSEGMQVVTGEQSTQSAGAPATGASPFTPQMSGRSVSGGK